MTQHASSDGAPLVSILIPCWGCREFIRETILSALAQRYDNFEVVVVEDHGDDGTYEEALRVEDPRVRVVRNEANLGQHRNKNRALELARGALIKFVDGDDVLEPECLELLVNAWQESGPGVGVVFGQFSVIDEAGRALPPPRQWGFGGRADGLQVLDWVLRLEMPGSMFGNVSSHLIAADLLRKVGGFPEDNAGCGDLETFLRLLCVTDVCFVQPSVARYRIRSGGQTQRLFGLREARDHSEMAARMVEVFRADPRVPRRLSSPRFARHWRLWASSHQIFPALLSKLRRRPNQFAEIRAYYHDVGLGRAFDWYAVAGLGVHVARTLDTKLREARNVPTLPPLFDPRFRPRAPR